MTKRQVRSHWFNNVKYSLYLTPYKGECSPPSGGVIPEINLPHGLASGNSKKAREDLYLLLHEVRHAQNFDLSETIVDREAKEIRDLLWRLGYRRVK